MPCSWFAMPVSGLTHRARSPSSWALFFQVRIIATRIAFSPRDLRELLSTESFRNVISPRAIISTIGRTMAEFR